MASVAELQLDEARECFDCEDGHRQAAVVNVKQRNKSIMIITMAFVFGYLIGVIDFGMILEGLGLEPAAKKHGIISPKVISFDVDCIWSHLDYGRFEECELTHHGDKTSSSQAHYGMEEHDFTKFVSAAFSGETRPRGAAMSSMNTAAVNPVASDSNTEAKAVGEGGRMAMRPGTMATSTGDAKPGENAGTTRKKTLKAVLSGAVAAAVFTPTASMAQAAPAQAAAAQAALAQAAMSDFSQQGINMFNNMRTPAALVAAACLNLAFAVPTDEKDKRNMRVVKRVNVLIGFASITSQLITVIFATNAINRLTEHAGTVETMATGLSDLLRKDLFVQFWLGVYIHFIIGIVGMLAMVAFRAWYFMGDAYNGPIGAASIAIGMRLLSAINRGVVVTEFGGGPGGSNFLYLIIHYLKVTVAAAWTHRRIADLISVGFGAASIFMFGKILLRRANMSDDHAHKTNPTLC